MNRKMALVAFAGIAAAAAASQAQLNTFVLNDGLFRYSEGTITGSAVRTGSGGGTANFGFIGTNTGAGSSLVASDYLFQNWWWYRSNNDSREFALSNQVSGIQLSPSSAFLRYSEPSGTIANAIQFDLTYTLNQITTTSAAVTINWGITNTSNVPLTISFFSYTDFDVVTGTNFATYSNNGTTAAMRVDQTSSLNTNFASVAADLRLPDAWQMSTFSGLRAGLADTAITNLTNAATPLPGDFTGAFQFNVIELAPGANIGGRVTKGYNFVIPAPGALALLGLSGLVAGRRRR
jgi:hypothetical protein